MATKSDETQVKKPKTVTAASRELMRTTKEKLFENFFQAASTTMTALEVQFGFHGLTEQLFGADGDGTTPPDTDAQMQRLRDNPAWKTLSRLYDYAVEGLLHDDDASCLVIDGSDVLWLVTSEECQPSEQWRDIVAMADGRFALDDGQMIDHYKVALLANVDLRTVRNAISAGDLTAFKQDDYIFIDNASARSWLLGRRGFRPTVLQDSVELEDLDKINTPAILGAYLAKRRVRLGLHPEDGKPLVLHQSVQAETLAKLEAGVFTSTLDTVFPLADFYQLGRKSFLNCIMRVFFAAELHALKDMQP